MKELDSFTVERLEELTALSFPPSHHELAALARIALAAKRAEPDYYIVKLKFNDGWGDETVLDTYETKLDAGKSKDDHGGEIIPVYTTQQPAHTEQAKPVYQFIMNTPEKDGFVEWVDCNQYFFNSVPSDQRRTLYTTPPLNHTEQDGWKLVPKEATLAMLTLLGLTGSFESMQERYANMLAAAPEKENG